MSSGETRPNVEVVPPAGKREPALRVADLMTPDPVTVGPDDPLARAVEAMRTGGFRRLPVVAESKLIGIVTERDIRVALSAPAILHERDQDLEIDEPLRIGQFMTRNPIVVSPETEAKEAARLLLKHKIGGLPVVAGEQLVGVITASDFLRQFIEDN